MAEDNVAARVSTNESIVSSESSERRKRRKRKWDQPAEFLVSSGAAVPGISPMACIGSLLGASYPVVAPVSVQTTTSPQLLQPSPLQQNVAQIKIQDELIAREMVINDAESSIRYKLTKRQTQEEVQKCTGAVVITRGKYRPPNAPPGGEKPLYLHISAGTHFKEVSERIIAVDRAAAMIEEILKQSSSLEQLSSTFHVVDGAKALRQIRDQYINHIMNETGVNVLLRGRGSGNLESIQSQEQEPLHLFLCGSNSKSLEEARCLAENLLDTISTEFGASRTSSHNVYNAVPPPNQMVSEFLLSRNDGKVNEYSSAAISLSKTGSLPIPPMPSVSGSRGVTLFSQGAAIQTNLVQMPHHSLGGATSYNGYGGIYPQASPLQQVALALRQPPSYFMSAISPTTSQATTELKANVNIVAEKEKKPPQRRKFQELPDTSKSSMPAYQIHFAPANKSVQGSSIQKTTEPIGARHISMMPSPIKLLHQSNGIPQSHPRTMPPPPSPPLSSVMPPPPPPPKFSESPKAEVHDKKSRINLKTEAVPETLIKLMEYGEEDDDDDDVPVERNEESQEHSINAVPTQKPFRAL